MYSMEISKSFCLVLPLFGQQTEGFVQAVSLLRLTEIAPWLRMVYLLFILGITLLGILTLALQNCSWMPWQRVKHNLSFVLNVLAMLLFILGNQPYGAVFLFLFLIFKVLMLLKK